MFKSDVAQFVKIPVAQFDKSHIAQFNKSPITQFVETHVAQSPKELYNPIQGNLEARFPRAQQLREPSSSIQQEPNSSSPVSIEKAPS